MTWAKKAYRRIETAQKEGRIGQKFRIEDVRRVYPDCPEWVLRDHRHNRDMSTDRRRVFFIQHEPKVYSLDPTAQRCRALEAAMRYHFECDRIEVSDDGVIGVKPSGETIVIAHPEDLARETP